MVDAKNYEINKNYWEWENDCSLSFVNLGRVALLRF